MTTRPYSLRASQAVSALLFATACGLTACAPDDDANGNPYVPPVNGGLTADASAVVVPDAGTQTQPPPVTTPDSGTIKPLDAGTTPVVTVDTGVPVVTGDAGPVVTVDAGLSPDAGGGSRPDQGKGDGKDVIAIGDSWMSYSATVGIEYSVEKASGQKYRKYGVSGTELLKATITGPAITTQYDDAKKEGPIKTVVMTAGGNDILMEQLFPCFDDAFDNDNVCKNQIDMVAAGLTKFWAQMAADNVADVLIVSYSNKTTPLGFGTTKKSIAYSAMKINPLCAAVPAPLRCTTLDTDMAVPDIKFVSDGIHPDPASYDKIGKAVWDLMVAKGMRR